MPDVDPANCFAVTVQGVTFILHEQERTLARSKRFTIIEVKVPAYRTWGMRADPAAEVGKVIHLHQGPNTWNRTAWRYPISERLVALGKLPGRLTTHN